MTKKKTARRKSVNNKDIPVSKSVKPKTELTEVEKFWVEQKCKDGATLEEVKAEDIKPIALVEQLYNQTKASMQESNRPKASDFLGRNERYGAVVMTQNAAELAEKNKEGSKSNEKNTSHIHKFRK